MKTAKTELVSRKSEKKEVVVMDRVHALANGQGVRPGSTREALTNTEKGLEYREGSTREALTRTSKMEF